MASIFLHLNPKKSRFYQLVETYKDPESGKDRKKWTSTKTDNKEKAEAMLQEIKAARGLLKASPDRHTEKIITERAKSLVKAFKEGTTTFEEAWAVYKADELTKEMKATSLHVVKARWDFFVKYLKEKQNLKHIEEVDYEHCKAFLEYLKSERSSSDGTIMNYKHGIQGMFKRVKRAIGLSENPWEDVRTPRRPKRRHHRCFTDEELKALFKVLPEDWTLLVKISYYTGLRFGDCCMFDLSLLKDGVYMPRPQKLERYNQELFIPLVEELQQAIKEYAAGRTEGYLFKDLSKGYREQAPYQSAIFTKYLAKAGIQKFTDREILDFHSLRHTFNTNLIESGVDEGVRMKLVGHSNLTTNQIYNHAQEALKRAVNGVKRLPESNDGTEE